MKFRQTMRDVLLRQVRVLDASDGTDQVQDVLIEKGALRYAQPHEISADIPVIDAGKMWLMPPLTDIHVHMRETGQEWKEDIESISRTAAAGGVGRIVGMANTMPTIDNEALLRDVLQRGKMVGLVEVLSVGACTVGLMQEEIAPLGLLSEAGAVAFSDDGKVIQNGHMMRRILELAKTLETPVVVHAEDKYIRQDGWMHDGKVSWELGLRGNPRTAEAVMVARDIELSRMTGAHVHIQHVSTADAVRLIRQAKEDNVRVTAEVCPHHIFLTDEAVRSAGTNAKMAPPLRTLHDTEILCNGLLDGTIDCLATDHAPHAPHEKELPFDSAPFGIIGLQTLLPLTLRWALTSGIPPLKWLSWLTTSPARVMKLEAQSLQPGSQNWILIAPEATWTLDNSSNQSKSRNSPWWDQEMHGLVLAHARNGELCFVHAEGEFLIE